MNIWLIQTGERLPVAAGIRMMRSGLLAKELARRGHNVTWWASAFDHYGREWLDQDGNVRPLADGLSLRMLRGIGYTKNVSIRRFVDHAIVAHRFLEVAKRQPKPDIIVAALPDYRIAYAAYRYARKHNIPFILDLRDRWPWDILDLIPSLLKPSARLLLSGDFWMAKKLIAGADVLVTMMHSWEEWIAKTGTRKKHAADSVFYLGAEELNHDPATIRAPTAAALAQCKGRWPVLFIGAFTSRSWPKIATEVADSFAAQQVDGGPRPIFILAGDGDFMPELRKRAQDNPDIVLPGFVNDAEIAALLDIAKVGLVTSNSEFEAMPNKVFTYLSGGVPIISSLGGELERFLVDEAVGFTCKNREQTQRKIVELMRGESDRTKISLRSKKLFTEKYEASRIYGDYAHLVERSARHRPNESIREAVLPTRAQS